MKMSNDMKKDKANAPEDQPPAWLVTFADLSTLLLTFFVLILSMSSMDDRAMKSMFTNFTSACGILYFKDFGEIYKPKEVLIDGLYERLQESLVVKRSGDPAKDLVAEKEEPYNREFANSLIYKEIREGFKLVFGHQLLFTPGSAEIKEDMKPVLDMIAKFMRASAYQIYIDGHTDNIPIRSAEYSTNEDLSLARAYNILEYLVREKKMSPNAIAIAGYGELRPVASNGTPLGRGENRRVEIIFKNKVFF